MRCTDDLDAIAEAIWDTITSRPVVEALGEGTLDEEPFRYWVRQDYAYLTEYSRVFAHGAAKAPTLEQMSTFADLLDSILNTEMDLHREYAAAFDISDFVNDATIPLQADLIAPHRLVTYCEQASSADLNAYNGESRGTDDPISPR